MFRIFKIVECTGENDGCCLDLELGPDLGPNIDTVTAGGSEKDLKVLQSIHHRNSVWCNTETLGTLSYITKINRSLLSLLLP